MVDQTIILRLNQTIILRLNNLPDKGMVKFFPIKAQVKFLSSTLEYIFKPLFHKPG